MKRYIIDRIEGDFAVCIDDKDKSIDINVSDFGFRVKEGLYVFYDEEKGTYRKDEQKTEKEFKQNEERLRNIFSKNKPKK